MAVSLEWGEAWGPWRVTPKLGKPGDPLPLVLSHWNRFVSKRGSLWDKGTRAKQARKTGADHDYGCTKGVEVFAAGKYGPAMLHVLGDLATAEACRPQQIHEADGSPVEVEKHPRLQSLGFRPHYRANHSEQLGKTVSKGLHGWEPMSFSHASNNGLACWTILSGSYASQRVMRHQVTWLRANKSAGWGEVRAYGRIPQCAAWCYLATGDDKLLDYFGNRWNGEYDAYLARAAEDDVAPWGWWKTSRDDWPLPRGTVCWIPWQEAIHARGLDALVTVHERYRGVHAKGRAASRRLARNVIDHGWYRLGNRMVLGYQIAQMPGKRGLTPEEYQDPKLASSHDGTAVDWWGIGVAAIYERMSGSSKAKALRVLYEGYLADMPLGFHTWAEWLGVR